MDAAPKGAIMVVETTIAPVVATSCTATGRPIFSAFCRIFRSKYPFSRRLSRSWEFLRQHHPTMVRLITAQASAVPIPAPSTPNFGMHKALNSTSSPHMAAFKTLGVTISPLHCKKAEHKEFSWENGSISESVKK